MGEVIKQNQINEVLFKLKEQGKTIVVTNGCFDILHVGHVKYLQKSKSFGDILVVLMNSDSSVKLIKGNDRPINTQDDRAYILCALSCVDYVILFDEKSPVDLLKNIKPDVYTKGADYNLQTLPEAPIILENGGRVEFIKFEDGKSTTNIIEKIKT
ncbi:MAG: D-glycero-beta-D-manno-heptose 1-phosphate adenylyltransferase [Cyanobacteria bacterium SIG30]|nr:D-glycero-beta-D-manno-heptose 1-phosphate adenylyltransferase [Cyanobacteria bacterium SIG30]